MNTSIDHKSETFLIRLAALKKNLPANTVISINGADHPVADVIAMLQTCLDLRATLAELRAKEKEALARRKVADHVGLLADKALRAFVVHKFGADSSVAHEFGYPPPKVGHKTVATKQHAILQNEATREARHTMGKKQKLSIHGTVVVPPAAPPHGAPPPTLNGSHPNGTVA